MIQFSVGAFILLFAFPFLFRGWVFTLKPEGAMSTRAKERNMRLGLETDMKKWGRRVRRFGFMLSLVGGGLCAWGYPAVFGS